MGARTWRVRPSMRWIWRLARWSASPCRTPMRATRRRASTRRRREREPVERGEQRVVGRGAPRQPPTRAARRAPSPCPARPPRAPASCPPPPSRAPAAPRSGGNGRHSPGAATALGSLRAYRSPRRPLPHDHETATLCGSTLGHQDRSPADDSRRWNPGESVSRIPPSDRPPFDVAG